MADTRENYSAQDKPLTVGGVRIGSAVSQAVSHSFSRVKDLAEDLLATFRRAQPFLQALDNPANLATLPVPLRRRAGTLKPSFADRDNKAYIEILSRRAAGARLSVGRFDDFVMLAIQEQDAEKVDVTETFGQPHIFASGRFVRRFTFSVACRAAPANYLGNTPELRLSQHAAFRYFYDRYLRATQQIERGQYTRVVVDGDVFEGYVTTLNQSREAQNEYWSMFVFSMLGTKRSNDRQDGDALRSLQRFEREAERAQPLASQIPQAELLDSHGELELNLFGAGVVGAKKEFTLPSPIEMSISDQTAPKITVQLEGKGYPGKVEVAQEGIVGVTLTLARDTKTPLSQVFIDASQEGTKNELALSVQYHRLYQSLRADGDVEGETLERTVSFTIKSQSGSEVVLNVPFKLKGKPTLKLGEVKLSVTNTSTFGITGTPGGKTSFLHKAYTEGGTPGLLSFLGSGLGNAITVRFEITILDHNDQQVLLSTFDQQTIETSIGKADVAPAAGSSENIDNLPAGDQFRIPDVQSSSGDPLAFTVEGDKLVLSGTLEIKFYNDNGSTADLSKGPSTATPSDNPFTLADRILIRFPDAKVRIAGYEELSGVFSKALGISALLSNTGALSLLTNMSIEFHEIGGVVGPTVEGGLYHVLTSFYAVCEVDWTKVVVDAKQRFSYIQDVLVPLVKNGTVTIIMGVSLGESLVFPEFSASSSQLAPSRVPIFFGSGSDQENSMRLYARVTSMSPFQIDKLSLRFEILYAHADHERAQKYATKVAGYGSVRSVRFNPGSRIAPVRL